MVGIKFFFKWLEKFAFLLDTPRKSLTGYLSPGSKPLKLSKNCFFFVTQHTIHKLNSVEMFYLILADATSYILSSASIPKTNRWSTKPINLSPSAFQTHNIFKAHRQMSRYYQEISCQSMMNRKDLAEVLWTCSSGPPGHKCGTPEGEVL